MSKKGFLKMNKKKSILEKKAYKLHDLLFKHINNDIYLKQTDYLFIELGILNNKIGMLDKKIRTIKMYL